MRGYRWGIGFLSLCALAVAPGASAVVGDRTGLVTLTVFEALDCPDGFESHPANGIDAQVFDVAGRAGTTISVSWTSTGIEDTAYLRAYSDDCEVLVGAFLVASGGPFHMPASGRWLAVIPEAGQVMTAVTVS